MTQLLSSEQAAALLGVSRATLYAYVSRGLVRSQDAPAGRRKQYLKEDIDRLLAIKAGRRDPRRAAAGALSWGDPVLDSAITLIRDDRLFYRGREVERLAAEHSYEEVAGLIWLDDLAIGPRLFAEAGPEWPPELAAPRGGGTFTSFQVLLPLASEVDPQAFAPDPDTAALVGARIVRLLSAAASGQADHAPWNGTAAQLTQAWAPGAPDIAPLINTALILIADHELNVSSFTVRCVASAGASLYAAVTAGLAALTGALHGGATERVEAFLDEARTAAGPAEAVRSRLGRGEPLPGFGHNLYSADPRARILLAQTAARFPDHPEVERARGLVRAVDQATGAAPTIDLGLVALRRAAGLPRGAALRLFAIGRAAGWVGHAIEQAETGRLIRPRARYVGR